MRVGLLLSVVAVPLLELALLIKVGQRIGPLMVVLILGLSAALGILVLRTHGVGMVRRVFAALEAGRPPLEPMIDGALVVLAGTFLVIPGFLTDAAGALLLIPTLRQRIARWAFRRMSSDAATGSRRSPSGAAAPDEPGTTVIEGEFERLDEKTIPPDDKPPPHS